MDQIHATALLNSAARTSPSKADLALKAEQAALFVRDFWVVIACILGGLMIWRLALLLFNLSAPVFEDEASKESGGQSANPRLHRAWRRLPSAATAAFKICAFRTTMHIGLDAVVSVSEFAFISGYLTLMLLFALVDTRHMNVIFWEDRAAIIAICQLPLIISLASKNNAITWITGVSYEKLNVLHRAAARTALLLLWMHAMQRYFGGLPEDWAVSTNAWLQCGVLALTALSLTAVVSLRIIRIHLFEYFLLAHNLLIGTFLMAGFFHTRERGYDHFLWPTFLVWVMDRFLRLGRIIVNNRGSKASIELLGNDTVRLTMKRNMHWKAGQHAYITVPSVSRLPLESHPFTIASTPETNSKGENTVTFLIRQRNGFTKNLLARARSFPGDQLNVYIDGPYGSPPDLKRYTTCILIAGGSGISYTLPLLLNLVRCAGNGGSRCRRILFVWSLKYPEHLQWISDKLDQALQCYPGSLKVDVRLYVTGPVGVATLRNQSSSSFGSAPTTPSSEKAESVKEKESIIRIEQGRPNVVRLLEEEISSSLGPVSVDVAGPGGLSSSVRAALTRGVVSPQGLLRGAPSVDLHSETFGLVKH